MKKAIIESLQCNLPSTPEPIDLSESLIIKDEHGSETIIGAAARNYSPEGTKRRGGNPKQQQYRNLLRGAAALLGEGEHVFDGIAFSTAEDSIKDWREKKGEKRVTAEQERIIRETLAEVLFKTSIDEEWKKCVVRFRDKPIIQMEVAAVARGIPEEFKTYLLWQMGFGDWQQIALIDAKPEPTSIKRVEGIQGAYNIFEQKTGLSKGQARKAWDTKILPDKLGFNGKSESASGIMRQCIASHVNSMVGVLLNQVDNLRDRIGHVILSGGASKNTMLVELLRDAVESEGLNLHLIEDIMKAKDLDIKDPSFATIAGLKTMAPFCLDIGNNFIKIGY